LENPAEKPNGIPRDLPASDLPAMDLPAPDLPVPESSPQENGTTPGSKEGSPPIPDETAAPEPDLGPAEVPGSDLAPTPKPSPETSDPKARGPIFRVRGSDAFAAARQHGFRFTPAQGIGRRDGNHTVASQVPNVLTSEVHGTRMMQMRPSPLWTTPYIENTFYMFCDASYNAVKLQPGWKIRGIQLKGPDWQWVVCPRSGANTASFSIRIRSWKRPDAPALGTVVNLQGITLEGPVGAKDWKAAFPDLNRVTPLAVRR
jgi:hypothetical protein